MDEERLARLAQDIDELKAAVKKNDPLMREILTEKGWVLLGLAGGLGVTLFAVPAHILSRIYGSFAAIPPLGRALVWGALVLAAVGGGIGKFLLINRRMGEIDKGSTMGELMDSFFGLSSIHVTGAMMVAIAASVAFAVFAGSPWHALPAIGIVVGMWMNAIGVQVRVPEYYVAGWWSVLAGAAGLFFVLKAPFLWVLAIPGGMFYAFAAAVALKPRRPK